MSTYTNSRRTSDTTDATDQDRTELSELRQRLFTRYEYVRDDDPELYHEIEAWLRKSVSVPDGSVGSAVKSRLRELKRDHKMRDHLRVDDPEEAFPDDCEGCTHYGIACPMVKRYSVTQTLDRILRTAETDEEVIEQLSDLAIDWDCHVVLDELDDYQNSYGEFLKQGYQLNARANDVLSDEPAESDPVADSVKTEFDASPSPEVEADIQETVNAVMGDDEDGDAS